MLFQYDISVERSTDGTTFTAVPALACTLWQKSTPVQASATFTHLDAGYVYRFTATAKGNSDGSAATNTLGTGTTQVDMRTNNASPTTVNKSVVADCAT